MAVKIIARASVTLSKTVDISSVKWYYKLQASTASAPSKPTTNPPSGWVTTEPTYTEGSTNSLYICELTIFSDNTWEYSDVSLSSSYEAAKAAYNKSVAAMNAVDNIEIGGRNLVKNSDIACSSSGAADTKTVSGGNVTRIIPEGTTVTISVRVDADNVVWNTSYNFSRIGCEFSISKTGGGTQYIGVWAGNSESQSANIVKSFTGSFHGRVSKTFVLQGDVPLDKVINLYVQGVTSGTASSSRVQLEIGNKATDWTPAPEDVEAAISDGNLLRGMSLPIDASDVIFSNANSSIVDGMLQLAPTSSAATFVDIKSPYLPYSDYRGALLEFSFDAQEIDASYSGATSGDIRVRIGVKAAGYPNNTFSSSRDRYKNRVIPNQGSGWHRYSTIAKITAEDMTYGTVNALVDTSYITVEFSLAANTKPIQIKNIKLVKKTETVEFIAGTQPATPATGSWTGVTTDPRLYTGKTIAYKLPAAGSGDASLTLTFPDGTDSGEKEVYLGTTRITTHFEAGAVIQMTYNGTDWRATAIPNTNNYDRRLHNTYIKAYTDVTAGKLICGTSAGYQNLAANVMFDLGYPILYASAAIAANTQAANTYEVYPSINLGTTGTIQGAAVNKMAYLKGTMDGNTFIVASSNFITCTIPGSADGYYYIPLGVLANDSTAKCFFVSSNRLFAYVRDQFLPVDVAARNIIASLITSQNGKTYFDLDNAELVTTNSTGSYDTKLTGGNIDFHGYSSQNPIEARMGVNNTGDRILQVYSDKGVALGDGVELYNAFNGHSYVDFHFEELIDDTGNEDYTARIIEASLGRLSFRGSGGVGIENRLETYDGIDNHGRLELYHSTPFIDFHFGNSTADNTARIIESSSGVLKAYNSIANGSDEALKKDILPIDSQYLGLIDMLIPVQYRFKKGEDNLNLGFVAQDVEDALDEIGIEDKPLIVEPANEDDYYGLDYNQIIPLLVMYCQDLRREINELKSRIGE